MCVAYKDVWQFIIYCFPVFDATVFSTWPQLRYYTLCDSMKLAGWHWFARESIVGWLVRTDLIERYAHSTKYDATSVNLVDCLLRMDLIVRLRVQSKILLGWPFGENGFSPNGQPSDCKIYKEYKKRCDLLFTHFVLWKLISLSRRGILA